MPSKPRIPPIQKDVLQLPNGTVRFRLRSDGAPPHPNGIVWEKIVPGSDIPAQQAAQKELDARFIEEEEANP